MALGLLRPRQEGLLVRSVNANQRRLLSAEYANDVSAAAQRRSPRHSAPFGSLRFVRVVREHEGGWIVVAASGPRRPGARASPWCVVGGAGHRPVPVAVRPQSGG